MRNGAIYSQSSPLSFPVGAHSRASDVPRVALRHVALWWKALDIRPPRRSFQLRRTSRASWRRSWLSARIRGESGEALSHRCETACADQVLLFVAGCLRRWKSDAHQRDLPQWSISHERSGHRHAVEPRLQTRLVGHTSEGHLRWTVSYIDCRGVFEVEIPRWGRPADHLVCHLHGT